MTIPDFQALMRPVLMKLAQGPASTTALITAAGDHFGLQEADRQALLPSGRQPVINNRVHWALAYLNKAGLITRLRRGVYDASDAGRALAQQPPDRITLAFLNANYPAIRAFRGEGRDDAEPIVTTQSAAPDTAPAVTPEATIDEALAAIDARLRDELLALLLEKPPAFFEKVVVDLLLAMGYGSPESDAGQVSGGTGDGGIDGVIRQDRLGLDLIYLQAKRYRDSAITSDQLRSFAGALDDKGTRKGVFITTSRFTAEAQRFADRQQMKRIILVDGERLTRLMVQHDVGVRADRTITLKKIDLDYFDPEDV
jgi:restriction system protein